MADAKEVGARVDRSTPPGYVIDLGDEDRDGVLNEAAFTRTEIRIHEIMITE